MTFTPQLPARLAADQKRRFKQVAASSGAERLVQADL
jgi:hypothetical protein